jgi:predicted nuclease with TOPRIM domain
MMDIRVFTERLARLREEIRSLQELNAKYREQQQHTPADMSAQDARRLRLEEIRDELAQMKAAKFNAQSSRLRQRSEETPSDTE